MSIQQFTQRKSKQLKERSSSVRNLKSNKQVRNAEYFGSSIKMPDSIQSNLKQSKQYPKVEYDFSNQKIQSKNLEDNEYIKSLYKKYLGKQNSASERKQKVDAKIMKNLFGKQQAKQRQMNSKPLKEVPININIAQTQQSTKDRSRKEPQQMLYCNQKYSLSKNKSAMLVQTVKQEKKTDKRKQRSNFYAQLMEEQFLDLIGDPRNSLARCMKNICRAKQLAKGQK